LIEFSDTDFVGGDRQPIDTDPLSPWSIAHTPPTREGLQVTELLAGWPAYACGYRICHSAREDDTEVAGALFVGSGDVWPRDDVAATLLPVEPIFPGFLLNTLFYAAIWFVVLVVPGIAKRAIRRKRGRCVKCGYDLRYHHTPCGAGGHSSHTECGGTESSHTECGGTESGGGCQECGWGREDADR